MAEKKIKGKVATAVKEFYDTVPPNRDPRMTGAKYRKYLRGLRKASRSSLLAQLNKKGLTAPLSKGAGKFFKNIGVFPAVSKAKAVSDAKDIINNPTSKSFIQRRITLGGVGSQAAKAAKATRIGKIAAGVAAAALATKAGLEKMYEKRTGKKPLTKRPKKKMGGGMMKKVPGYKKGSLNQGTFSIGPFKPKPGGSKPSLDDYDQMKKIRKKMGGGMMMRRPMMASEGRLTSRDVQAAKDALKIKKAKPGARGSEIIRRAYENMKNVSKSNLPKKMGGGLTEATKRLKAQGLKTGGSACRGMGAALRGGDFKGVK